MKDPLRRQGSFTVLHLSWCPAAHRRRAIDDISPAALQGHGRATSHKPELILSGFGTRLGHRISRIFSALFAQVQLVGRCCLASSAVERYRLLVKLSNPQGCCCCSKGPQLVKYTSFCRMVLQDAYMAACNAA